MIEAEIINRKGARKAQDIPKDVLRLLNEGKIPTVNLTEWLAMDQHILIRSTFHDMGLSSCIDELIGLLESQKKQSTMSSIKLIGLFLYSYTTQSNTVESTIDILSNHPSDTIRCYAPYLIAQNDKLSIEEKLERSRKLIADPHFGVREIVWMALRPEIEKNLSRSIYILSGWTNEYDENIRRFTTEATRPRGVWCKHIEQLKNKPELALTILDPLKSDASKYVQDSVGNWLNDASKTQPNFVINLCEKWKSESQTTHTNKIVKRALRTIHKK